ncbi:hypothetical protein G3I37_17485 [Streptomyces anulatus]|uniref:Uncharacterized protein n=1 Tax=Streptomyces anulatus TaxID=1892 RepID=A0A7K3RHC8_STRAQ|nr:hypothetical protein [Streptomyces anulatus]NEC01599.1 hypothetical protein [Streptomyces anulatus]NED26663.1 hypothetical protein [Streptomyces anulatus]
MRRASRHADWRAFLLLFIAFVVWLLSSIAVQWFVVSEHFGGHQWDDSSVRTEYAVSPTPI